MHRVTEDLHPAVRQVMCQAAERAILPRFRRLAAHEIREKDADEVVTVADHESEAILAEGLSVLLPGVPVVGEEAASMNPGLLDLLASQTCWIVDPLDGTANFAAGRRPFGILVALSERGRVVGGWILDPLTGRFCSAAAGKGLLIDGARTLARPSGAALPIAAISSLFVGGARLDTIRRRIEGRFRTVSIPRCAAEQYPRLVLGINDLTLFHRTLPWDHAAGVLCLEEAGGRATRLDGSPYRTGDRRTGLLAASTPGLWQEAQGLLADLEAG